MNQMYSFLAWLLMSAMLIVMSVPYVLFLEPIISTFAGGSSIGGTTVRKPLLVVLGVVAATVLLLTSVLPSIDGTYADHMPYLYIAGEGAFLTGWFFGMTYCIAVAVSKPGYPLAHIGITPAIVGVIFLLSGLAAAGMVKDAAAANPSHQTARSPPRRADQHGLAGAWIPAELLQLH